MVKASIKGFELRNITHFLGHEQEDCYQGFIYYKGKKVGYYSDDSWGGQAIIDFFNEGIDKVFNQNAKEYLKERYPKDTLMHDFTDMFFTDILQLISIHNDLINDKKEGFQFIAILSQDGAWCSERAVSFVNEQGLKKYVLENNLIVEKIFREDADFIID